MEDEDFKIINLNNRELKVFRDGGIYIKYIYNTNSKYGRKGDIKWTLKKPTFHNSYLRIGMRYKGKPKYYLIHRIVAYTFLGLDINNPKMIIDHIDMNKQNNYWLNLRIVTPQQNNFNSKAKGYYYRNGNFEAYIKVNGKKIYLGTFEKEEDARDAYLEAKKIYHII